MKNYATVSIEIVLCENKDVIMSSSADAFIQDDIFDESNQGPMAGGISND